MRGGELNVYATTCPIGGWWVTLPVNTLCLLASWYSTDEQQQLGLIKKKGQYTSGGEETSALSVTCQWKKTAAGKASIVIPPSLHSTIILLVCVCVARATIDVCVCVSFVFLSNHLVY